MKPGVSRQPAVDGRRFTGPVVVEDERHVQRGRHRPVNGVKDLPELERLMPVMPLADHPVCRCKAANNDVIPYRS